MRHGLVTSMLAIFLALGLTGCRDEATLPVEAGTGPDPKLPPPKQRLIPTVDVAHAIGWPAGATPHAAPGFEVKAFARDLAHPRWLYVLPNGDLVVCRDERSSAAWADGCRGLGHEACHEMGWQTCQEQIASRCYATKMEMALPRQGRHS